MNLGLTVVNVGEREFAPGLTYTACSRVKTIEDLVFDPFPNFLRFKQIFMTKSFKDSQAFEKVQATLDRRERDLGVRLLLCKSNLQDSGIFYKKRHLEVGSVVIRLNITRKIYPSASS